MRRNVLIGVTGIGLLLATGLAYAQEKADKEETKVLPGKPRLVLSTREWNFGQLWYGDPCKTEVELKNIGEATLKIDRVKSSCGCTLAKPKKKELAPGETDTMVVTYDTKKNVKTVVQTVTIYSNDPIEPSLQFRVRGEVWNVFDGKPYPRLAFGMIKPDSKLTRSIELISNLEEPLHPKLRQPTGDVRFKFSLEPIEEGRRYRLSAETLPPLGYKNNFLNLVIETGNERMPEMKIPVSAVAMERVKVRPEQLRVVAYQDKPGRRTVYLYYDPAHPVEITALKSNHPSIEIRKQGAPRAPSDMNEFVQQALVISIPAYNEFPESGAIIEIHTDDKDPKFQKFTIPIHKKPKD